MKRQAKCYEIDIDGEPVRAQFDKPPSDEAREALAQIVRYVRAKMADAPTDGNRS